MSTVFNITLKVIVIALFLGIAPLLVHFFNDSTSVHSVIVTLQAHQAVFLVALLLGKALSIIYPPLPGAILSLSAIPVVGWAWAYTIDILGSLIGSSISYFLGKKYGEPILKWAIGERFTTKVTSIRVKPGNQMVATFMLRIASGGMLSDGLAWGASLIGLRYRSFITGYLASHVLTTLPIFYLLSLSLNIKSWIILVPITVAAWLIIYKFKGKYFE